MRKVFQASSYFRFFGAVNIAQIVASAAIWITNKLKKQHSEEVTVGFRQLSESGILEEEDLVNYFGNLGDVLFEVQVNVLYKLVISI